MTTKKPDAIIAIDAQGFHLPLLKTAKKLGIKTVYYIAPQEWQWGSEKGGRKVVDVVDHLLAIFPEEATFYKKLGADVHFVGHPIMDMVERIPQPPVLPLTKGEMPKEIALFPGSRKQEIIQNLPILLKAANILQQKIECKFIISQSLPTYQKLIQKIIRSHKSRRMNSAAVSSDDSHNLIQQADLSPTTSGRITLEHCCLEKPFVAMYRFSSVGYAIIKLLVGEKRFFSLAYPISAYPIF